MRLPGFKMSVSAMTAAAMLAGVTTLVSAAGSQTPGESTDLKKRVAALEAEQKTILKELQAIRALLEAGAQRPTPAGAPTPQTAPNAAQALTGPPAFDIAIAGAPTVGRADAKLVLVEFSDFQCPFCGRYIRETFKTLQREYVDTGKIRYVFRHYPIEKLHPLALRAAEAADCAHAQGRFWDMHERLYGNQQALQEPDLVKTAQSLGLNMPVFQQCFASQAAAPLRIRQDQNEGARAAISGTPTFFVGTLTKEGKVHVLRRLVGAKPYAYFKANLDELLGIGPS